LEELDKENQQHNVDSHEEWSQKQSVCTSSSAITRHLTNKTVLTSK